MTWMTVLLGVPACTPKVDPPAAATPDPTEVVHRLPSGTRFSVARGWTVHPMPDGVRTVGPEGQLVVHLVEHEGADPDAAIAKAWQSRRPDFDRRIARSKPLPADNGWTSHRAVHYETSPEENRWVYARASTAPDTGLVMLVDLPLDHAQRRRSELELLRNGVMAPGFTPERYAGRTPRPLDAQLIDGVRDWVQRAMAATNTPGVAVALFDRDTVVMAEGFGVRQVGQAEPITADTPFLIASNTKPLTTLLLAKLVDEGKFAWDTPVTEVHPSFQLGDDATTAQVQMRHLVCACTGLPRLDNEWLFTYHDATPATAMAVLGSLQPTTPFGELYQYSNPLAAAAGYVGASVAFPDEELGEAYDRAMQTLIFDPLGMSNTTFDFDAAEATGATPHGLNQTLTQVPVTNTINRNVRAARPGGGAWSTVHDVARFGQLELTRGELPDGTRYISEANLQARHKPQIRIDHQSWYGMGLVVKDVKGVSVVSHGGALVGFTSNFFLVPEAGVGGVVMTNADNGALLTRNFSTHLLELLYEDDSPEALQRVTSAADEMRTAREEDRRTWTLPVSDDHASMLAERYESDTLGGITVRRDEDGKLYFVTDGWTTEVATKLNPDDTLSFVILEPGLLGYTFLGGAPDGAFESLSLVEPQRTYVFRATAP